MISCDEFLKILVEEDGGRTPERKAAFAEHEASCDDCRELAPTMKEAYDAKEDLESDRDDPMEAKVMALAAAHVAKKAPFVTPATVRTPRRIAFRALAMAAVLLVGLGLGFLGGYESRPEAIEVPAPTLDGYTDRLWLAHVALKAHLVEDAHDLAKRVLAEPGLPLPVKKEAQEILDTK